MTCFLLICYTALKQARRPTRLFTAPTCSQKLPLIKHHLDRVDGGDSEKVKVGVEERINLL